MSYEEFMQVMGRLGLPFAYDHFPEGKAPKPPYAVFLFPRTSNFGADGKVYQKIYVAHVEIYTDVKDPPLEKRVEDLFDEYGLFYNKTESYISSEKLFEVLYEMEVL